VYVFTVLPALSARSRQGFNPQYLTLLWGKIKNTHPPGASGYSERLIINTLR